MERREFILAAAVIPFIPPMETLTRENALTCFTREIWPYSQIPLVKRGDGQVAYIPQGKGSVACVEKPQNVVVPMSEWATNELEDHALAMLDAVRIDKKTPVGLFLIEYDTHPEIKGLIVLATGGESAQAENTSTPPTHENIGTLFADVHKWAMQHNATIASTDNIEAKHFGFTATAPNGRSYKATIGVHQAKQTTHTVNYRTLHMLMTAKGREDLARMLSEPNGLQQFIA
jgi:hypothetical protein